VLQLLEKETLDKAQVAAIFADIRKRPSRPAWTGSAKRAPQAGPVMTPKELASPTGVNGQDKEHSMGVTGPTDVPDAPLPSDEIPGRPLGFEG
jgi:cell division protease FtsH